LIALKKKLIQDQGLTSQLAQFTDLDLVHWPDIQIGGHEIRKTTLVGELQEIQGQMFDAALLAKCKSELARIDKNIKPGILTNVGSTIEKLADPHLRQKKETPRAALDRIRNDLDKFQSNNKLDRVLVLNLASTEPPISSTDLPRKWSELEKLLDKPRRFPLASSSLYAIAALQLKMPYLNFTPSVGSSCAAIEQLAVENETCHMGRDGKTGETLMKSVLAPMFAARNLPVMSWVGHNIFGNRDGLVLDDPINKQTKVQSKDQLLSQILGYHPQTLVSIEYIESLGEWKTAWDHIHFQGFLGTPMTLQFTWQGCDSILAAPLAIDLFRFAELSARNGEVGLLTQLACFFKSPTGVDENDFVRQFQLLEAWAECQ
jgi:myo-inositol-1-phosphate synthase